MDETNPAPAAVNHGASNRTHARRATKPTSVVRVTANAKIPRERLQHWLADNARPPLKVG